MQSMCRQLSFCAWHHNMLDACDSDTSRSCEDDIRLWNKFRCGTKLTTTHLPLIHIIVFAAPTVELVRKTIDLFKEFFFEGGRSTNQPFVCQPIQQQNEVSPFVHVWNPYMVNSHELYRLDTLHVSVRNAYDMKRNGAVKLIRKLFVSPRSEHISLLVDK